MVLFSPAHSKVLMLWVTQASGHPPGQLFWGGEGGAEYFSRKGWGGPRGQGEREGGGGDALEQGSPGSLPPSEAPLGESARAGGYGSWGSGDSKVCLPGRAGAAARGPGRLMGGVRWKEWGGESKKNPRGRSWAPKGPGTREALAQPDHRSYRPRAPQLRWGCLPPRPPRPSSRAAGDFAGKWLSKVVRRQCSVLRGVPGWSLHVSLCISKAQSHPVCANHHN